MLATQIAQALADGADTTQVSMIVQRAFRLPVVAAGCVDALAEAGGVSRTLAAARLIEAGFEAVRMASDPAVAERLGLLHGKFTAEAAAKAEGVEKC